MVELYFFLALQLYKFAISVKIFNISRLVSPALKTKQKRQDLVDLKVLFIQGLCNDWTHVSIPLIIYLV